MNVKTSEPLTAANNEIVRELSQLETRTLFDFNEHLVKLHKKIIEQIEKRGYLVIVSGNTTEH